MEVVKSYSTSDPDVVVEQIWDTNTNVTQYFQSTRYNYQKISPQQFQKLVRSSSTPLYIHYRWTEGNDDILLVSDSSGDSLFINSTPIHDKTQLNIVREYINSLIQPQQKTLF